MYQVEFVGGEVTELTAIIVAESIYTQCGEDGIECLLLDLLAYHHTDDKMISQTDFPHRPTDQHRGKTLNHKSTASWQIYCQWKDGSTSLGGLSKLKEIHPVCCCTGDES